MRKIYCGLVVFIFLVSIHSFAEERRAGSRRDVVMKALAIAEAGGTIQDLISKLGRPVERGSDVPFFGPVYGDETGKFLFAPLEAYRNSFRETKDGKIGIVIYFAIIGEIHMPPVYVYPIELRGQIAVPPKSAIIDEK